MAPCSCTACSATKRAFADFGFRARCGAAAQGGLGVGHQRGAQRDRARLVALHRHVREPVADHLVGGKRPTELLTHLGIFQCLVEQDLHDADGLGTQGGERAVDHALDLCEAIAAVAEQSVGGKANICELEVAGAAATKPRKIPQGDAGGA
jgi:hypothetical protein